MPPRFNINRPPVSDEEIEKHKNFDDLVAQFKKQSLKKARGDESWWRHKKVKYSAVIMGVTVVCTITYSSITQNNSKRFSENKQKTNETITTSKPSIKSGTTSRYVDSKLPHIAPKPSAHHINNQKGAVIKQPSGTVIKVPKGSFVDKKGVELQGDITLEYREFHDKADIIAAGIPMNHDSSGVHHQLETAGMFEVTAKAGNEPVFLAAQKTITVELASKTAEDRFNQYYLDTVSKNWRYLGPDKPKDLNSSSKPVPANEAIPKITYQSVVDSLEQECSKQISKLPAPAAPGKPAKVTKGRPTFNLDGSYEEFPELAAFKNVLFEVGSENKNVSPDLYDITWSDIKMSPGPVKGKNYKLNLSYRNRSEELIVYPVLQGEDYNAAMRIYEKKLADYNKRLAEKEQKEARLREEYQKRQFEIVEELRKKENAVREARAAQEQMREQQAFDELSANAKARRIFEIRRLGIYNSDCPHSTEGGRNILASFQHDQKPLRPEVVYLINHSVNTVAMNNRNVGMMNIQPGHVYSLCLVKEGMIYTCTKNEFMTSVDGAGSAKNFILREQPTAGENLHELRRTLEL